MTDISKHPLLKACYEACVAIEKLGCSPEQTDAVSRVSDMMRPLEALIDERDAALAQVAVLREALERHGDHNPDCATEDIDGSAYECDCGFDEAFSNTSATAQQFVEAIRRKAVEEAWKRVEKMPPCEDWDEAWDAIRAAILGEKAPE